MRRDHLASEKLQAQIDAYLAEPIKPGDKVIVAGKYLKRSSSRDKEWKESCVVKESTPTGIIVFNGYHDEDTCEVLNGNFEKDTFRIGNNPFAPDEWRRRIRTNNMNLECLILRYFKEECWTDKKNDGSIYKIKPLNWNPFVINKNGEKEFYQRDFCWTLKDKQLLIDSIYNRINCGTVMVRCRSIKWLKRQAEQGEDVVYEWDIVDGKQRLNTIFEFISNKFPDSYGNYWNDLSDSARCEFEDSFCFTLAEMEEGSTDEDTIKAFLSVNFTGVPMSKEHIEFVKEINKKM